MLQDAAERGPAPRARCIVGRRRQASKPHHPRPPRQRRHGRLRACAADLPPSPCACLIQAKRPAPGNLGGCVGRVPTGRRAARAGAKKGHLRAPPCAPQARGSGPRPCHRLGGGVQGLATKGSPTFCAECGPWLAAAPTTLAGRAVGSFARKIARCVSGWPGWGLGTDSPPVDRRPRSSATACGTATALPLPASASACEMTSFPQVRWPQRSGWLPSPTPPPPPAACTACRR